MKAADQIRPSSRRGASGAWNRLKPVRDDPLETYGLPSKGEMRLNDLKTQESYYNRIVERYMKFCAASNSGDDLDKQFASLSLKPSSSMLSGSPPADAIPIPGPRIFNPSTGELSMILSSLRKLREAITATARRDQFAQRAYIFNIHAAILCKDWESYSPAFSALLNMIHPHTPLSPTELHEYVGYKILDQACRQGDFSGAYETKHRYKYSDRRVELVLKALISDNWVVFWKMKKAVDGYQRRIMEYAEQNMRLHALKCLGRGYMRADRAYVERCADRRWADLKRDGVGWELVDGERVIIKRPKGR
ncbi:uncharacterized protein BDR25DRAFT_329061 [Lindgomyces ingoldianus]|uniref:Uncharacterized protein n=1 Tax=Lindgomyces ingoldianus TaxID=673940 RepID=A0ACB6QCX8_9PLEO|nr:uncharacterized protein BDR25DRAFT_329061 [Lindgomyces ingoldianus]KAF2464756.1 hypothetical protein BDR25DRAFT_329061 [Lindgomyces ingoldianus]